MKKTLIALMALAGISHGAEPMEWTGSNYDLSDLSTVSADTIGNTSGWIITKTGDNTSPAPVVLTLNFTITALPGAVDQHLISFSSDANEKSAYGFTIKTSGMLEFGRMDKNKITSDTAAVTTENTVQISTLTLNTAYTLTLVSKATGTDPGRGDDNFDITLVNSTTNATIAEKTGKGFGLNGGSFEALRIGSAISDNTTVLKGTISSVSVIPEPTTATLSLLALAGLAARRRRR